MTPRRGTARTAVFTALAAVLSFAVAELGGRALLAFRAGPRAFLYGVVADGSPRRTLARHDDQRAGYSKYPPDAVLQDFDPVTGDGFRIRVNARGFRGAAPVVPKPAGVVRVVTLGASSTFGYHARDGETWPERLQAALATRCPDATWDVVNLGMPHLMADEIAALFRAEALPLDPDVVTFYEGVNDASLRRDRHRVRRALRRVDVLRGAWRALRDHLVLVRVADELARPHAERWDAAAVRAHAAARPARFLAALDAIRAECARRGIRFVVATQQATSLEFPRDALRGMTYAEEEARLARRLDEGGTVPTPALSFLAHAALMRAERDWADANGVPLVDVVAALDARRDVLVSWVHLTPEGNALVAAAFAPVVAELACAGGASGATAPGAAAP